MGRGNAEWIAPFACLSLIALLAMRPLPQVPKPAGGRVVVDGRGKAVHIQLPFRGSLLTRGTQVTTYLEATNRPDSLIAVTAYDMGDRVRDHIMGRIFPSVVGSRRIWFTRGVSDAAGPKVELERLLSVDPGVYIGWYTLAEPVERAGLPFVGFKDSVDTAEELGVENLALASVVGDPGRGAAINAQEAAQVRQLDEELALDPAVRRPRILYLASRKSGSVIYLGDRNDYWRYFLPHAGVVNACICDNRFATVDAEHVMVIDPEVIVLDPEPNMQTPEEFVADPRWRTLSASIHRRVYRAPPGIDYFIASPFLERWLAELIHPERLKPSVRIAYRAYIQWLLGYHLTENELDVAFAVADNRRMMGVARSAGARSDELH